MAATHGLDRLKQAVLDSLILEIPPHIAAEDNDVDEEELDVALTAIKSGEIARPWDMPHFIEPAMPDLIQPESDIEPAMPDLIEPESERIPAILPPTII